MSLNFSRRSDFPFPHIVVEPNCHAHIRKVIAEFNSFDIDETDTRYLKQLSDIYNDWKQENVDDEEVCKVVIEFLTKTKLITNSVAVMALAELDDENVSAKMMNEISNKIDRTHLVYVLERI